MKDLGARSLTAVFWGSGGTLLRILLQFVIQVALARMLGPQQYGLFAIGAVIISFSTFFSDFGLAYGLIQKAEVSERDVRFVFTWQWIIGCLVTGLVASLSGRIATFFGDEGAAGIVAALSVVCLLNALAAPSLNLLKRRLNFKRLQGAQLLGYFVGYVLVGMPLALYQPDAWALVVAWLVQATVSLVVLYTGEPHALRPIFWFAGAWQMARYGATVLVTNITNWVISNIDRVVIGRQFQSVEIGLYATTYNILHTPATSLLGVVQPVFFSASVRISDDAARVASAYRALSAATALFVMPVFFTVAAVSETFILGLYGEAWRAAGALLCPLALAMPFFLLWGFTTPLFWLGGAPEREFKTQLPVALAWAAVAIVAAQYSVLAVAWAACGFFLVRYMAVFAVAKRVILVSYRDLWKALQGGLVMSLLCATGTKVADAAWSAYVLHPLAQLLADVCVAAIIFAVALKWCPGLISKDCFSLLERLAQRCPPLLSRCLRSLPVARTNDVIQ